MNPCPMCQKLVSPEAHYCPGCGHPLPKIGRDQRMTIVIWACVFSLSTLGNFLAAQAGTSNGSHDPTNTIIAIASLILAVAFWTWYFLSPSPPRH